MDNEEFNDFIRAEQKAIENSIWIESEKVNRDLHYNEKGDSTQKFFYCWIVKHAKKFRISWEVSCCRKCLQRSYCEDSWKCKDICNNFKERL